MAAVTAVAAAEAGRKISALMAVLLVSKAVFYVKKFLEGSCNGYAPLRVTRVRANEETSKTLATALLRCHSERKEL